MELERQRCELIERLGVCIENNEQLAPLAARILATLVLIGKKGVTFDQLVADLNASKSTISSHLSFLENSGKINYFTKSGDRKRYFTVSSNRTLKMIDDLMEKWDIQKQIHRDILQYKQEYNKTLQKGETLLCLEIHNNYLIFLEEASAAIQKLKQTHKNNT